MIFIDSGALLAQVSFTDCVSFALMRTHGVRRVFTFDRHFALAGYVVMPASSVHDPGPPESAAP